MELFLYCICSSTDSKSLIFDRMMYQQANLSKSFLMMMLVDNRQHTNDTIKHSNQTHIEALGKYSLNGKVCIIRYIL